MMTATCLLPDGRFAMLRFRVQKRDSPPFDAADSVIAALGNGNQIVFPSVSGSFEL
jgi:hypothetical protein